MTYTQGVATTFEVLAEPSRRRILDLLLDGERPVGELVEGTALRQPTVSKHLRVLREAGLVEVTRDAQRRLYRIRPEPLRDVDGWLAPYRALWASRLDALEAQLDAGTGRPSKGPGSDHRTGNSRGAP
jgi:DNA-binding transcriptional ArsR family regulator